MEIAGSKLVSLPVVSKKEQRILGTCTYAVFDADTGKLSALSIKKEGLGEEKMVLGKSIMEILSDQVVVFENDTPVAFASPEGKQVLEQGIRLEGNRVVTTSGDYIGEVKDYVVRGDSMTLGSIIVSGGMLKDILKGELVIGRDQIVSITKKAIIVKDVYVRQDARAEGRIGLAEA